MWPTRRQVLEDFPLAWMTESDCLAESGEGLPIANVQNVLVVAGHDGRTIEARCAAPCHPPNPSDRVDSESKEGCLHPIRESLTRCRQGEARAARGSCLNRPIRVEKTAKIGAQIRHRSIEQDCRKVQTVGLWGRRDTQFGEDRGDEPAVEADCRGPLGGLRREIQIR